MLASDLATFHRWFLPGGVGFTPGVVLHGSVALPPGLAASVARHLNEFDEDGQGRWSAFSQDLIQLIAETPAQRSLLNLGDGCLNCPPNSLCGRRKVLEVLARRGYAVLEGMLAVQACEPLMNVFRVSLGPAPAKGKGFHLCLQPELFSDRCLTSVIGDTYLEWIATRELGDTV